MLMAGTELTYVNVQSNKLHVSLLVDRYVAVKFGRRSQYRFQTQLKEFPTEEKARAYYWNLVRGKMAKGYHVVDAAVLPEPDRHLRQGRAWVNADWWMGLWEAAGAGERRFERQRVLYEPDTMERSPRTPKQGAHVLEQLTNEECDPSALVEYSLAHESERFLRPMAMSHPNCPDIAHVAVYLSNSEQ